MSSYDSYTVKFRLTEAAKNLRQIYSSDPTQLYTHLLSCMEYEKKLLAHPLEQIDAMMVNTTSCNSNTIEITQTLIKLQEKIQECENFNHTLRREYEKYNSVCDDFKKRNLYYDACARQQPEQHAQFELAKRQQNEHLMQLQTKINSLRLSLMEEFRTSIEQAEKILETVKNNFLYEWMKQQKLDALKYIGAQSDSQPLEIVQIWYEKLAEIFWKSYDGLKTMKNYLNDQESFENLLLLEQKSLRLLENLIVTSFIVEKQPSQIIVQERNGGKK